ncbi:Major allergen Pru av 1 [Glycine max]|nr:Major allergen Pru av 1 [Glycine max]
MIVVQFFLYKTIWVNLTTIQNVVQENIAEKRKLEEDLQNLESECSDLKKQLQEEHKCAQRLTIEFDKRREAAQIAMREVEAVRQVLQEEREHTQRVKENFRRDVIFVEARATFAEEKLSDLYRKIRMSYYKVCSICLSNEKDLVFGCGHMTCRDCGSKLSKCPICREQITNHIKLFPGQHAKIYLPSVINLCEMLGDGVASFNIDIVDVSWKEREAWSSLLKRRYVSFVSPNHICYSRKTFPVITNLISLKFFGNVMPKAIPNFIKSAKIIGERGSGSIKKIILVDMVDKENYMYLYTTNEGNVLLDTLEKVCYEYKLVASPVGGHIIKSIVKYYTKGDAQLLEEVNDDAFCKYCHKSYKTNSSKHGTTNLTKHVRDCQKRKQEIIALGKGFKGDTNVVTMKLFKFNQDCTHITLAKIIIMNELSFQFVENERVAISHSRTAKMPAYGVNMNEMNLNCVLMIILMIILPILGLLLWLENKLSNNFCESNHYSKWKELVQINDEINSLLFGQDGNTSSAHCACSFCGRLSDIVTRFQMHAMLCTGGFAINMNVSR